jgi:hypothetical protein
MDPNKEASYWTGDYPMTVEALALKTGKTEADVAEELALISGDRASMPDDEVLATFLNDNLQDKESSGD